MKILIGEPWLETRRGHYWEASVYVDRPDGEREVLGTAVGKTADEAFDRARLVQAAFIVRAEAGAL